MEKKSLEEKIFEFLEIKSVNNKIGQGHTTNEITRYVGSLRSNVSAVLNKLYRKGQLKKIEGRPVRYVISDEIEKTIYRSNDEVDFSTLIGSNGSLKKIIRQAKAAVLYPPKGIHTLLLGPTGVGKTMFASLMHKFASENGVMPLDSPFIEFNCADYSNNPQLLIGQLFGYKKGAYTGADREHHGIVEKADGGVLFLDEIHRLPAEGQELLFYLIDKGEFCSLGDTVKKKVNILLVCATTEQVDTSLLQTFKRRIPMTIYIPSLKERTLEERFLLISDFFQKESRQVNRRIIVTDEVIKSLLLYPCIGNIGQLKSDIKLTCANAFLDCIGEMQKKFTIELHHLPDYVKQGMLYLKDHSEKIEEIIQNKHWFSFAGKKLEFSNELDIKKYKNNFYGQIEKKLEELHSRQYSEEDIRLIMTTEIEGYFNKYIRNFDDYTMEISKIVNANTIKFVDGLLGYAGKELHKVFPVKVFHSLCLHMQASLERMRIGKPIINYKFGEILEKYPEEFKVVHDYCRKLEHEYDVKIPVEEIAFITMFLSIDKIEGEYQKNHPLLVIAMHGRSTASSMAEVVNCLLGIQYVLAYDMNLDKSSKICYEELKQLIKVNNPSSVILLVDMGSLGTFGELISEELGIDLRVIHLVTTVMALEAARKVAVENNIDIICQSLRDTVPMSLSYGTELFKDFKVNSEFVIITLCVTGEGSAVKIKNLIEDNVDVKAEHVEILPMSISDDHELGKRLQKIATDRTIIAIVGTINPHFYGIPFISLSDLIMFNRYDKIRNLVKSAQVITEVSAVDMMEIKNQVFDAIKDKLKHIDVDEFKQYFELFIKNLEDILHIVIDKDTMVGLIFHVTCAIDILLDGKKTRECKNKKNILQEYTVEIDKIKQTLAVIEKAYSLDINIDEICFILQIIKQS